MNVLTHSKIELTVNPRSGSQYAGVVGVGRMQCTKVLFFVEKIPNLVINSASEILTISHFIYMTPINLNN